MSKKISAEKFFDNLAATYDEMVKKPDCNGQQLNEAKKVFEKYHHREGSILDVGCGTGLLSDLLEGHFEYTGIDISKEMLQLAAERGYKTIHKPIENALFDIESQSYDCVVSLGSLFCVEDIQPVLKNMRRIARKVLLIALADATEDYIQKFTVQVYNHTSISMPDAIEDYRFLGWISPTTGISLETRMIYVQMS